MRLLAYMGSLALLALVGLLLWSHLPIGATGPVGVATWGVADRSYPAFAVSHSDLCGKTEAYEILRHPEGGRKDVLRWTDEDHRPVAELEVYRPGREWDRSASDTITLAGGMEPGAELEMASIVDSKFGAVTL